MSYCFVKRKSEWWLKLSTKEELENYFKEKDRLGFSKNFADLSFQKQEMQPAQLRYLMGFVQTYENGICKTLNTFARHTIQTKTRLIQKYGCIYVNCNGVYDVDFANTIPIDKELKQMDLSFPIA